MTAAATEILALLAPDSPDTWPQGILATADLREQRAKGYAGNAARPDHPGCCTACGGSGQQYGGPCWDCYGTGHCGPGHGGTDQHIAAEANPRHSLAAVRRWRGVAERHRPADPPRAPRAYNVCAHDASLWPCPDLTETADEARAYLGGPS